MYCNTKFKDRQAILKRASEVFDSDSVFYVNADYTKRVKKKIDESLESV